MLIRLGFLLSEFLYANNLNECKSLNNQQRALNADYESCDPWWYEPPPDALPLPSLQPLRAPPILQDIDAQIEPRERNSVAQEQATNPTQDPSPPESSRDQVDANSFPSCLRFIEPLRPTLWPCDIVLFSGGDNIRRRLSGYGRISAESLVKFASHHDYNLVFLDELNYNKELRHNGEEFCNYWQRVFALPALREKYPWARYFVWFDDDVLVPHQETHMLNHYINLMEMDPLWHMTFAEEGGRYVLNSGLFIMKNNRFTQRIYELALDYGAGCHLRKMFGFEQDAIAEVRSMNKLWDEIRVIRHRTGNYNFNNFARNAGHDPEGTAAEFGDAFVHFTGLFNSDRERKMIEWNEKVAAWRSILPSGMQLPCIM